LEGDTKLGGDYETEEEVCRFLPTAGKQKDGKEKTHSTRETMGKLRNEIGKGLSFNQSEGMKPTTDGGKRPPLLTVRKEKGVAYDHKKRSKKKKK